MIEGRYRIEEKLGKGGMGAVYRALDLRTGEHVALKRMNPAGGGARRVRKAELRFRREFHTLASLRHPRIVRAFDYGVDAEGPYYTMELLGGEDLRDVLRERGPLAHGESCAILRDVASALASLHARGLIHRDLTPRNVRVIGDRAVLFDFGVLVNAGWAPDVAGTVSFVAPEMVRGLPIDGRADLYSLGVLAYVMLTGMRPFEARDLNDLPRAWREPITPPSSLVSVPEGIEDLVLDLLCLEPLGRPPSAALLIDRLTTLGGLAPDPALAVDPGYLGSGAMVGRDAEVDALAELAREVAAGGARSFFVEAESGAGKSRLLTEVTIRAKLEGLLTLRVACESSEGAPFASLAALVAEAFEEAPELASAAAAPDAALLGRVLPAVRQRFPARIERNEADAAELRMRVQSAVERFVRALAAKKPLFLSIDDVQRCDEASAAALAGLALAEIRGLLVGIARRTGEPVRAPVAVASLSRLTPVIHLAGLDAHGVEALLRSLFGDVVNLPRLARRMAIVTGGSPLHCAEVARQLIETGEVRYAGGSWIVPESIPERLVPEGLAVAMRRRVAELDAPARRIGEVLAVASGENDLEHAIALADTPELRAEASDVPAAVFAALGALTRAGVLVDGGDRFRFRHDSLREALLEGIDADRRRALHLHVGAVLLEAGTDGDPAREAEAGWHLHAGGDDDRGAAMLERAGRRLFATHALADCIAPLETALAWRARHRAPDAVRADLACMLVAAGWVSSREVGWRHAQSAVDLCGDLAGVSHAARWGRTVGWHVGLAAGVCWAWVRWALRRGEARGPTPSRMLTNFGHSLAFATAIAYSENRKDAVRTMAARTEPFRALTMHAVHAVWLMPNAMSAMLDGQVATAIERLELAQRLVTRAFANPMTKLERDQAEAGVRATKVLLLVNQFLPSLDEELAASDAIGLEYYRLTAQTARIVRHRYRGEEEEARALEAATEATSMQLGSWSTDLQRLLFANAAYPLCHDVDGIKRCIDGLGRLLREDGMEFERHLLLTRAELHRELGEHDAAHALLAPAYEALPDDDLIFRQFFPACLAQTALEAYRYDDAERYAHRALEAGADPRNRLLLAWLRAQRVLGLAEDALGRSAEGARRLEDAITIAEAHDCPVLAGELHEARARVALAAGDRQRFELHRERCSAWLRPTANPGLIAVVERLTELARGEARGHEVDVRRRRPATSGGATRESTRTLAAVVGDRTALVDDETTNSAPSESLGDAVDPSQG